MSTLIKHEYYRNRKTIIIWLLSICSMCLLYIFLFPSLKESMEALKDSVSSMGFFSEAMGMNKINIGTMQGYYAIEIGTVFCLAGAIFSAMLGTAMLSKEEDGHTGDFLLTLPISRRQTVAAKYLVIISILILFNVVTVLLNSLAIVIIGETMNFNNLFTLHLMQFLSQIEIASICFLLSAIWKHNKIGAGIGIAMIGYVIDMLARVIPKLEDIQFITPFSYANAPDIFSGESISTQSVVFGLAIIVITVFLSFTIYEKKDIAS